jgi:hypothetical protein
MVHKVLILAVVLCAPLPNRRCCIRYMQNVNKWRSEEEPEEKFYKTFLCIHFCGCNTRTEIRVCGVSTPVSDDLWLHSRIGGRLF